jgi:predicted O-methyltransferase YrrM
VSAYQEDWFGEASREALADLFRLVADLEGDIIEVGSWEGRSTVALANAAHPAVVHAVDTWQGSPGEVSHALAAKRDVFATFQRNVADDTRGNVEPHRQDWRKFFAGYDGRIRLLFIDAEHSYREVRDNIEAALPFMVPGGIICGDDNHHPPVQRAVVDTLGDASLRATVWWKQLPASPLEAEYERLCRTPSDIYLHLPTFVRLVGERNAQHVLELGTRTGVSTVAWLFGLSRTGGRLTSVDIDARPAIGEHDAWTFVQGDDMDPAVFASLEPADILFLDTSHHYEHTLRELNLYRHLVRPGGVIVCHDTELMRPEGSPRHDPPFPVRRAIEEFCEAEGLSWTNDPRCWGLAQIEVP